MKRIIVFLCLYLGLVLSSGSALAFDYDIYGADSCYLTPSELSYKPNLLRCPLSLGEIKQRNRFRVRIYTLPNQVASECHLAGSNNLAITAYRFSRFLKVENIEKSNGGIVYEAYLSGEGLFLSESEGITWKMNYEIQCPIKKNRFLQGYSVMTTQQPGKHQESWVMY